MNDYSTLLSLLSILDKLFDELPIDQRFEVTEIMIEHLIEYQNGVE